MFEYNGYRTLVVYKDINKAIRWYNNFIERYQDAISRVQHNENAVTIFLKDDSIIDIVPFVCDARGRRVDSVYYDSDIPHDDALSCLVPMLTRYNILPFGDNKDETK